MASTPNPSMRRTRGLPRRDYNALHNGLVSSPSEQSNGPHSGENLAEVVLKMLAELDIVPKLLTITGDNAGNNGTLCDSLHDQLLKKYDNDDDRFRIRPLMRFRGRPSFIPCLTYILNLICKDVLAYLRAGSAREAKAILDDMAIHTRPAFNSIHSTKGAIIKIQLLTLWIARSP
jgi:hypothetical protein